MPVITGLERQQNNSERVNVYLDGTFAFGLNIMDAVQLRQGQEISQAEVDALQARDSVQKAVDRAVNLLATRPRSEKEIRDSLHRKSISVDVIDQAIDRLTHLGYLDDVSFARFWIEDRNRFKPRGPRALRYELRQRGVSDTIIEAALEEIVEPHDAAYRAAQQRIRTLRGLDHRSFRQKLGAFLQRRGFGYETINDALRQIISEIEEDDPEYFGSDEKD